MIKKICTILFIFIKCCTSFGQKPQLDVSLIIDSLKNNANSVIRLNQVDIDIKNQRTMTIKTHRIITIFNKNGINDIDAIAHYDKKTAIKNLSATIYNAVGQEIVKFKLKDFRDQCVIDGATIFSDSRIMFLDYTPTTYPFTVEYDSEVATSNTAFIARFEPIQSFYSSIQKSTINITFPEKLGFKFKEYNFENYQIKKNQPKRNKY